MNVCVLLVMCPEGVARHGRLKVLHDRGGEQSLKGWVRADGFILTVLSSVEVRDKIFHCYGVQRLYALLMLLPFE